ncbi:MAG TPA: sensor histidine kinase, partial [Rhodocyclaceae bacterium]|nr:sensor histidine kinase [Rhodocyclaceae bacterium]
RFLAQGELEGEFICQRKDGTRVEVEYRAAANFMPGLHLCSVRDITARRQAEAKLARYTEHLKRLSRRLVEVQEDERRKLSRELHDRTGQNLTAINLHLSMIREQVAPQATAIHDRVDDAMTLVGATLEAVRDVMADLRPPVLDDYGLLAALNWYGDIFSRRTGLVVAVAGSDATPRLSKVAEAALFRVAQEAFNNVAKHAAGATRIDVTLEHGEQTERLIVADDGGGFDPASERPAGSGWGILSMEERCEAVGGVLQVLSVPGQGTRIVVEVPHAGA